MDERSSRRNEGAAQIRERVRALGWWYQCFELPGGVMTSPGDPPAYHPETRWNLIEPYVPLDLRGKTVLDVGGNAGYFSVQMMKRGAARCTLVEPFVEFADQARLVADLYGYEITVLSEDVHTWCLTTDHRFDYVLFLGLFYHLKYPNLVLDRLAEMTRERMFFQSQVGDSDSSSPTMAFIEKTFDGDPTNWWIPNAAALEPLIRSAGMKVIGRPHSQVLIAEPDRPFGKVVYDKLVFPQYGKSTGAVYPGEQRVDPEIWRRLLSQIDRSGPPES